MFLVVVLIGLWWWESQRHPPIEMQLTRLTEKCEKPSNDAEECKGESVQAWLRDNWYSLPSKRENTITETRVQIPTGIFIQSLRFDSANEINLTGYLWQKFSKKTLADIGKQLVWTTPLGKEIAQETRDQIRDNGFVIFPEEVSSSDTKITLADEILLKKEQTTATEEVISQTKLKDKILSNSLLQNDDDEVLFIWYFDTTLRQRFSYDKYPFDTKEVWVKIWPRSFGGRDIILIPDLASYKDTTTDAIFGIEKEIVWGGWERKNTFFDYECSSYDTTFGAETFPDFMESGGNEIEEKLKNELKLGELSCWWKIDNTESYLEKRLENKDSSSSNELRLYPTLRYNIVVKRKFLNAFIINFIPLFVVAMLLFGLTLMITGNQEKAKTFDFTTSGIIGSCSALFFTVMLSHIQLRDQFEGTGFIYMGYFYLLMYFIIMMVAINSYLFSVGWSSRFGIIPYRDNLIPKVVFWPFLLWTMVIITLIAFEYVIAGIVVVSITLIVLGWGIKSIAKQRSSGLTKT
jgi:hypothetical protein